MKKYLKIGIILLVGNILFACSNFDINKILYPSDSGYIEQTIPAAFAGRWVNKKNPSYNYCYPQTDFSEYAILNITPEHNVLEFIGLSLHKVAKFYSLTQGAFSAQVKAKTIDMGEINEEAEDKIENLSAKLVDKNTIIVDSKRYYRCP